ncbi:MAG: ankyrin repeat domain-containing protein, partial [Blastocatellia bacterium]
MKHMVSVAGFVFFVASACLAQTAEPSISPARMAARKQLGALSVEYSRDSFVKRASEGDTIAVKFFLEAGMKPDATDKDGDTALCEAARNGYIETVRTLVALSADVNARSRGETPLMTAARSDHPDIVEFLLDRGADVNAATEDGYTALILGAPYPKVVHLLIGKNAQVNTITDVGGENTALIRAAVAGQSESVRQLLDKGADVNDNRPAGGGRPVLYVVMTRSQHPDAKTVKLLLEHHSNLAWKDPQGHTLLPWAVQKGDYDVVTALIDAGMDIKERFNNDTSLVAMAVRDRNTGALRALLDKGADPNARDWHDITPLIIAAEMSGKD